MNKEKKTTEKSGKVMNDSQNIYGIANIHVKGYSSSLINQSNDSSNQRIKLNIFPFLIDVIENRTGITVYIFCFIKCFL